MPVLLELYRFWLYGGGDGEDEQICPACGELLEAGQTVTMFTNRWTRRYYIVHEWCEVPLHKLLTKEEIDERNLQTAS